MHDDVSAIPSTGCSVLSSSDTISNYNNNTRKDFVYNGGTWYLYRTQTASYGSYDTSSYNCINVNNISSNAMFEPFFYFISFSLFAATLILFFKTIKGFLHVI